MKTELTQWKFKYIENSCTLGRAENGNSVTVPVDGAITGLGSTGEASFAGFDDAAWKNVTVPHDWAVTMPFSTSYSSGTGYLAGGIGWYRCHFTLNEEQAKKHVRILFEGVYKKSAVWCNSNYLGKWAYGFTPFEYDLTGLVHEGDNVISVKVMHPDIADCRWYTGSGIIRKVYLDITENVFVKTDGVFFSVNDIDDGKALVRVSAEIKNGGAKKAKKLLTHELIGADGKLALKLENIVKLAPGEEKTVVLLGVIENPELWSIENPALYTLKTSLSGVARAGSANPAALSKDETCMRVGIRAIWFDADEGFLLNGKSVKFKGVCVHDDAGCLGNAVPAEVWRRRLEVLKSCGCNAIRMAHNPHLRELYSLCDEMGFLVMDEVFDEWEGCKNKWSTGHNVYPPVHQGYAEDFHEWYEKDVAAFVRRTRNNPSVVMWSVGNEIDYPNDPYVHPSFATMTGNNDANKPAAEKVYNPQKPNIERLSVIAATLANEVRKHDTTRPVTLASAFPELTSNTGYFDALDIVGYNYKEHLYADDHKRFPALPILGSENGHTYEQWKAVRDNDYISGQFIWTGIDFLGETVGWPVHGSEAGILTTAGFPKTQFWFRKSLWYDKPFVKIVTAAAVMAPAVLSSAVLASNNAFDGLSAERKGENRWHAEFEPAWNYNDGQKIDVRIFSVANSVTLSLGGKKLGVFERDENTGFISVVVPYAPLPLVVTCDDGSSDTLVPVGSPVGIEPRVFNAGCEGGAACANSTEVAQIELCLKDAAGNIVAAKESDCAVYVEVSNGTLLGIDNGNQSDNTPFTSRRRNFYKGRMVVYVRPDVAKCCANSATGENARGEPQKKCCVTFFPEGKLNPVCVTLE